jgi:hypothetical protein
MTIGIRIIRGFTETEGLQQERRLSPTFFKIYLENVLYDWKKKCKVWDCH